MIPDISISFSHRGCPAPYRLTLGTQDPPDQGRPGRVPGTFVLNRYRPWDLFGPGVLPCAGARREPMTGEEIVRYLVARAVWSPSVHNTQPWRFTVDDGPRLSLYADAGRRLAAADPDGREMLTSCGAALFTIRLALRSLGYVPVTHVLPDPAQPDLVAWVS